MHKKHVHHLEETTKDRVNHILEDDYISSLLSDTSKYLDEIEGNDIPRLQQESFPGAINIEMTPIKMSATLEIQKPINSDNQIPFSAVKDALEEYGDYFSQMVDWKKVHDLYSRVFVENEIVPPAIIAKGVPVKPNIPEHILLEAKLTPNIIPDIEDHGTANFHHIHSIIFVEKDELLGTKIESIQGQVGKKLDGADIPAPTIIVNIYTLDENCYLDDSSIYASIDGTFKIVDNAIIIDPCLAINTDLDYHTGDVDFKGDIQLTGSVRSGFNITCGGDIFISETVEPTNIKCENNLTVNQGIFGSTGHSIDIKGNLAAKHTENAIVRACKDIEIDKCIVNSNVYCNGKIIMGKSGTITGGTIFSQQGISAFNIGNINGIHTDINLGVDFIVMDRMNNIQKAIHTIKNEMVHIQHELTKLNSREEKEEAKSLFLNLRNKLNILNNHVSALLKSLDKNEKSSLTVTGTIFPGTKITICHVSITITEPLKKVTVYLNKVQGRVEWKSSLE